MKPSNFETNLARLMLGGTLLAAAIMLAGLVWFLAAHPGLRSTDHIFTGEPNYLENPVSMLARAFHPDETGHRRSGIMVGIFLLLINPLARVAFAAAGYAVQRDRLYTTISLIVLAVLLVSFFW